jgi:AmiR/NasT family two-component response regulator
VGRAIDPLVADRVLDQAWRGRVGVAKAVARATQLSDFLRRDAVVEGANAIISERHKCSLEEAFARLVFVSQHTKRSVQELADEVVASGTADPLELGAGSARLYRFTL